MSPDSIVQPSSQAEPGDCYYYFDSMRGIHHYLQQQRDYVLHVLPAQLLNLLDREYIRETPDLQAVSKEDFAKVVRETIFALEIYEFWKA